MESIRNDSNLEPIIHPKPKTHPKLPQKSHPKAQTSYFQNDLGVDESAHEAYTFISLVVCNYHNQLRTQAVAGSNPQPWAKWHSAGPLEH